jgi:hypothetical protein
MPPRARAHSGTREHGCAASCTSRRLCTPAACHCALRHTCPQPVLNFAILPALPACSPLAEHISSLCSVLLPNATFWTRHGEGAWQPPSHPPEHTPLSSMTPPLPSFGTLLVFRQGLVLQGSEFDRASFYRAASPGPRHHSLAIHHPRRRHHDALRPAVCAATTTTATIAAVGLEGRQSGVGRRGGAGLFVWERGWEGRRWKGGT